jgi:cytochrome P450
LVSLLDEDRALWRQLVDEPDLIPTAVDELLRFTPLGLSTFMRRATEDLDLPSGHVDAGDTVLIPTAAAMRDAAAYPEPDRVRFDRDKLPNLAFGGGAHMCLGINLALSELRTSVRLLTGRLPDLRLAIDLDSLRFSNGDILESLLALPVAW